ncbi:MAG: transposase [Opitutales bacterium]|nr:transposase [Opitutales bacterium]
MSDTDENAQSRQSKRLVQWPHAPTHRLSGNGTFIVTVGTYGKVPVFKGNARLSALQKGLLKYAGLYGWHLEAWAIFPNHYHFVGHSPSKEGGGAASLSTFIADFHKKSATWVNDLDASIGRQVWHNFWETRLTHEKSYFARLAYVHQNPVRHGLVKAARDYAWCSAGWFERTATRSMVRTIYSFKADQLKIPDDF